MGLLRRGSRAMLAGRPSQHVTAATDWRGGSLANSRGWRNPGAGASPLGAVVRLAGRAPDDFLQFVKLDEVVGLSA